MTLDDFQFFTRLYVTYPRDKAREYAAMALAAEAGHVAGHVCKEIHDGVSNRDAILSELGDVLHLAATVASEYGFTLEEAATDSLRKSSVCKPRGAHAPNPDEDRG